MTGQIMRPHYSTKHGGWVVKRATGWYEFEVVATAATLAEARVAYWQHVLAR